MLVASMNIHEIRKEVLNDLPVIAKKIDHLYPKLRREVIESGKKIIHRYLTYQTRQYNKWLIRATWDKRNMLYMPIIVFEDRKGLCAVNLHQGANGQQVDIYHTHFFERYRERLHKYNLSNEQLVRELFDNKGEIPEISYNIEGYARTLTFHVYNEGVGFGELVENEQIEIIKTFVPFYMLAPAQLDLVEQMRTKLNTNEEVVMPESFITHTVHRLWKELNAGLGAAA